MKINLKKAIEVNNEHQLIVDEQQDDIFKFFFYIYDNDEIQEIT